MMIIMTIIIIIITPTPISTPSPIPIGLFRLAAGFAYGSGSLEKDKPFWVLLYGCALLLIAICADAFVPNAQQKVMSQVLHSEHLL
jgi:hypothetical protein